MSLGWPLPTTPMAMKMGISWIVYTIVCAKRKSSCSVRKCVISFLPLRLDRWGAKGGRKERPRNNLVTQTAQCVPVQGRPGAGPLPVPGTCSVRSRPSEGRRPAPTTLPKLVHAHPGPQSVSLSNNLQVGETTLKAVYWHPHLTAKLDVCFPKHLWSGGL